MAVPSRVKNGILRSILLKGQIDGRLHTVPPFQRSTRLPSALGVKLTDISWVCGVPTKYEQTGRGSTQATYTSHCLPFQQAEQELSISPKPLKPTIMERLVLLSTPFFVSYPMGSGQVSPTTWPRLVFRESSKGHCLSSHLIINHGFISVLLDR